MVEVLVVPKPTFPTFRSRYVIVLLFKVDQDVDDESDLPSPFLCGGEPSEEYQARLATRHMDSPENIT